MCLQFYKRSSLPTLQLQFQHLHAARTDMPQVEISVVLWTGYMSTDASIVEFTPTLVVATQL